MTESASAPAYVGELRYVLQGKSVLIVEDEFLIAELLEDMIRGLGCERVGIATSVPRAWEALEANKPDLVVLDLNLDGVSTLPLTEILKSHATPFIVSSGYDQQSFEGCQDCIFLIKPYSPEDLKDAIKSALLAVPAKID